MFWRWHFIEVQSASSSLGQLLDYVADANDLKNPGQSILQGGTSVLDELLCFLKHRVRFPNCRLGVGERNVWLQFGNFLCLLSQGKRGWLTTEMQHARTQRKAAETIENAAGWVRYDGGSGNLKSPAEDPDPPSVCGLILSDLLHHFVVLPLSEVNDRRGGRDTHTR
jgi:hypothetical protein